MNKWDRLLDVLALFHQALETTKELFHADEQVRNLLIARVPFLAVPGIFGTARGAITDLTITVKRLQAGSKGRVAK